MLATSPCKKALSVLTQLESHLLVSKPDDVSSRTRTANWCEVDGFLFSVESLWSLKLQPGDGLSSQIWKWLGR